MSPYKRFFSVVGITDFDLMLVSSILSETEDFREEGFCIYVPL